MSRIKKKNIIEILENNNSQMREQSVKDATRAYQQGDFARGDKLGKFAENYGESAREWRTIKEKLKRKKLKDYLD